MTVHPRRLILLLAVLTPASLVAQAAAPPLNVLTVYRETVKPGKTDAHDAHEEGWAGAVGRSKSAAPMLAMSAMSGAAENWYMSLYPNWAAMEAVNKANAGNAALVAANKRFSASEGDYLSDGRLMILTRRDDLSYGPEQDLSKMRYFSVTRIAVRQGHGAAFEENRKMIKAAHEATKLPDSYAIFQASSGETAGTFYIFVARKSLSEVDDDATNHAKPAYVAALGGAAGQAKLSANAASAVMSSQVNVFSFSPQQSVPPAEWIASDAAYWKHKVTKK